MRTKTYEDDNTEDQITKAVMICDGKTIDVNSLVTLTKKSSVTGVENGRADYLPEENA